jgi:hypothetical protein
VTFTCPKGHTHQRVAEGRGCYMPPPATPPVPAPSARTTRDGRHVVFTESEPTPRQVDTIKRLGGVMPTGCTRGQASSIIGQLYARRDAAAPTRKETRVSTPTNGPDEYRFGTYHRDFPFPAALVYALVSGERSEARFAVSKSGTEADDLVFLRVSLIKPYKSGKRRNFQGCVRLQTQHSDDLIDRFIVDAGGKYRPESTTMSPTSMAGYLASVVADPRGAAATYGRALHQCCVCGKTLTDERSRWYGIGPDCETRWPEIIVESDDARGPFVPSVNGGQR